VLRITLKSAASSVRVTISRPAVGLSRALAGDVEHCRVKTLRVTLTATDTGHRTTRLALQLSSG
jgi:hypothetical protein